MSCDLFLLCYEDNRHLTGRQSVGKDNYIGQQIGLIGFDDTPEAALTQPSLTMISTPTRQMGQLAGQRLLAKMKVRNETAQQFILPPQLIERGSA